MKKLFFALTLATIASAQLEAVKPATIQTVQLEEADGTRRLIDLKNIAEVPAIKVGTTIQVVIEDRYRNEQIVKGRVVHVF